MKNGVNDQIAPPGYWQEDDASSRLQEKIRSGSCIAFVGSGPSIGAGYPDWIEVVKKLCSETGVDCPAALEREPAETLLRLADNCRQTDADKYCDVLFRLFASEPPDIPESLHSLAALGFKSYVTTTFDPLLRRALEFEPGRTCDGWYCYPSVPTAALERRSLLHIHGKIDPGSVPSPSVIVLTGKDFDAAYDPANSPLWSFCQQLFTYYSCCFVGCGLKEPAFAKLLEVCHRIRENLQRMGGVGTPPEHFALLPEHTISKIDTTLDRVGEEIHRLEAQETAVFGSLGITVVRYKVIDGKHVGLREFLHGCMGTRSMELRNFPVG